MSVGLWLAAFIILIAVAAALSGRGRAAPSGLVSRAAPIALALALAGLAAATPWVWGGIAAVDGRAQRLRDGIPVRLGLASIAIDVDRPTTIGWSPRADLRLPGTELDTDDVARIERAGERFTVAAASDSVAIVTGHGDAATIASRLARGACERIAASTAASPGGRSGLVIDGAVGVPSGIPTTGTGTDEKSGTGTDAKSGTATDPKSVTATGGSTPIASTPLELTRAAPVIAIACRDGAPHAAVAIRRAARVEITPLRWRGGGFTPSTLEVHAGDVLQIGAVGVGLPGVTTWEMPAPAGQSALLAVPADPTECSAWAGALGGVGAAGVDPSHPGKPGAAARPPVTPDARIVDGRCVLGDGTFAVVARPIAPDADGVIDRGIRIAIAIAGPAVLLLICFAAAAASRRRARALGALSRVAVLAAGLGALLVWRMLWAHRIDVLRDLDSAGARVDANLMSSALVAASLAGIALSRLIDGTTARIAAAFVTWAVWAAAALWIVDAPIAIDRATVAHLAGQVVLSIAGAVGLPLAEWFLARRATRARLVASLDSGNVSSRAKVDSGTVASAAAAPAARTEAVAEVVVIGDGPVGATEESFDVPRAPTDDVSDEHVDDLDVPPPRRPLGERLRGWLPAPGPGHALLAIAAAAAATRALAPRFVLGKLALAYLVVIAGHAALRAAIAPGAAHRRAFHAVALLPAVAAVAALDVGVALVIVGVGLGLAMIVAGHDAVYDAGQAPRLGVLEREHARLVGLHGVVAIAAAAGAVVWAVLATDQDLLERSTAGLLHAPLAIAIVFAAGAIVARSHRRPWAPWLAAALAALALWGARDIVVDRAIRSDGVGAHRVAVVVDPGYALLRDDHRFVATVAAWREAALPADVDPLTGQGYFGARLADPGVLVSVENDYLPVLVARERGVGGLVQTTLLLLALVVAAGATAAARLGHASRAHRSRWLVAVVVGALCVYQPLAALGVLPLTGISWPGLGIDSPADLWLVVLGAIWLYFGADRTAAAASTVARVGRAGLSRRATSSAARVALANASEARAATVDERIRSAPRLRRARRIATGALAITALAGVALVARAGASALGRGVTAARRGAASGDARVDRALAYASTIACPWADHTGARPDDVVPVALASAPTDASTTRFDRELATAWTTARPALIAKLAGNACSGRAGGWSLAADSDASCRATLDAGWPAIRLAVTHTADSWRATCAVALPDDAVPQLDTHRTPRSPRIRLVSAPIGAAATDLGELVGAGVVIRLRPSPPPAAAPAPPAPGAKARRKGKGAAPAAPAPAPTAPATAITPSPETAPASGLRATASVDLGGGVIVEVRADHHDVVVRGPAEILIAAAAGAGPTGPPGSLAVSWQRQPATADERVLDRLSLVAAGAGTQRRVWLFRPPRAFGPDAAPTVDPLLADDVRRAGDRTRRTYTYGAGLPELGWTNPFDLDHSLGLDGWVHAALAERDPITAAITDASAITTCGTLAPPAIARDRVCSPSPLDGVLECRVALQPELALALHDVTQHIVDDPTTTLGRTTAPTRAAYVVLRGDTGEVLAQGDVVPGRGASAYAPVDAAAETALIRLREDRDPVTGAPTAHGEADGERADWNLPIAIGSTLKPLLARAAEQAFPDQIDELILTAIGRADAFCRRSRSGRVVPPMVGHCPPTPLTGEPTTADLHDFLARSPNWYMAALGIVGLGLPAGKYAVGDIPLTLADIVTSDLAAWPTDKPLTIADDAGPILTAKGVSIAGLRRAPLWNRFEAVLGRPLCTLGDQGSCRRAAERRDVCAARALPIATPTRDLRQLVALGPDRIDFYGDDRPDQRVVATREYFQLLRGSGVHPIGSLAQLTDAFGRVVYDPTDTGAMQLAASWFPTPAVGVVPTFRCAESAGHVAAVRGVDGGLCAVMRPGGTAHAALSPLLADATIAIYGGKTGTIDSLADIARRPKACAAWNARHTVADRPRDLAHQPGWLDCGAPPPDDSLFVLAFGVTTPTGTVPITIGVQLQRGGKGTAARAARLYVDAIAAYLRR